MDSTLNFGFSFWTKPPRLSEDSMASIAESTMHNELTITFNSQIKLLVTISRGKIRLCNGNDEFHEDVRSQRSVNNEFKTQPIDDDDDPTLVIHESTFHGDNILQTRIPKLKFGNVGQYKFSVDQWENIHRFCAATVAEIEICEFDHLEGKPEFIWPNVEKLIFLKSRSL